MSRSYVNDSLIIVKTTIDKANLLYKQHLLNESFFTYSKILSVAQRNDFIYEEITILNELALIHIFRGEYEKALKHSLSSLLLGEKISNKVLTSQALSNIGLLYYQLGNASKALAYYFQSLKLKKETNNKSSPSMLYSYIALCYIQINENHLAEKYLKASILFSGDTPHEIRQIEFALGLLRYNQNKISESWKHCKRSYEEAVVNQDLYYQMQNLLLKSKIKINDNSFNEAKFYLVECEKKALKTGYKSILIDLYKQMACLYKIKGDTKYENVSLENYIAYKDQLFNSEFSNRLATIHSEYEQGKNINKIAYDRKLIRDQHLQTVFVSFITILLVVITIILINNLRTKKKINNKLLEKVNERSKAWELQHYNLILKVNENNNLLEKTAQDIRAPLATMRGIYNTARLEFNDQSLQDYLEHLNRSADNIDTLISRISFKEKLF